MVAHSKAVRSPYRARGRDGSADHRSLLIGFKLTEHMAELRRVGNPTLSRYGTWQKPPDDEVSRLNSFRQGDSQKVKA